VAVSSDLRTHSDSLHRVVWPEANSTTTINDWLSLTQSDNLSSSAFAGRPPVSSVQHHSNTTSFGRFFPALAKQIQSRWFGQVARCILCLRVPHSVVLSALSADLVDLFKDFPVLLFAVE